MQVFETKGKPQLLVGSDGGHFSYIPGTPDDEKQLA